MFTIDWRRRRGSNSHILSDFTRFERDKHAGFARLLELVWAAGFKPTASRFQTGRSDQAELYPEYAWLHRGSEPGSDPFGFGRPGVIRTLGLTHIRRALCQLSYWSFGNPGEIRTRASRLRASRPAVSRPDRCLAGRKGLEPSSTGSTVQRFAN